MVVSVFVAEPRLAGEVGEEELERLLIGTSTVRAELALPLRFEIPELPAECDVTTLAGEVAASGEFSNVHSRRRLSYSRRGE